MDSTAPTARAATRALAVLAVLLGLLAMHGLAGAHHAAASPADAGAQPGTASALAQADTPAHHGGVAVEAAPAAPQGHGAIASPSGPSCDGACPTVAALCLAVLAGAALALFLARRRLRPAVSALSRPPVRAPAPPARHARGPDPVRELCVSRT